MDKISELPDALLLRVLSLLPTTKDVVDTMVLSKRWQFLWMFVQKLVYDDSYQNIEYRKFSRFVDRSLLLHEAPFIETLHFKLGKTCSVEDIRVWTRASNKCSVRELIIEIKRSSRESRILLPKSFYKDCTMLVVLKLNSVILPDFSSQVSFPSLKTMGLLNIEYPNEEFVTSFLSCFHVLEDLEVTKCGDDNVSIFAVRVPSLKSLVLRIAADRDYDDGDGFVINAPYLEYLDIQDHRSGFCVVESEMPNILKADVDVIYKHLGQILSCITSVKNLNICLSTPKDMYPVGTVFHNLVLLKICTCETEWLNTLMCMLGDSPNLRVLKLIQFHNLRANEPRPSWNEPSLVPKCVLSSLETLEWVKYDGTEEEKELVRFILRNGSCLKKVTISSKDIDSDKKLEMVKDLTMFTRRSPTCQLSFN
ncbi:unnamed protein product [Cochlearia groenlandica]